MEKTTIKDYNNGLATKDSLIILELLHNLEGVEDTLRMKGYRKTNGTELLWGVMGILLMLHS